MIALIVCLSVSKPNGNPDYKPERKPNLSLTIVRLLGPRLSLDATLALTLTLLAQP